ncbi:MAG: hypothetical protein NXI22_14880 [bacterium]|nr:hypothetical protein [bacterium]
MNVVTYIDRFLHPGANIFTLALANAIVELRADDELPADID